MIGYRFVQDNRADLAVERMSELIEVPRSSSYAWLNGKPSVLDIADEELLETIADIYARSRNTYGVPRVYGQLSRSGRRVARSRIARLMRANGLVGAHSPKKWRRGRPDAGGVAGLLNRDFSTAPNQRWVADISEFKCGDGKLYLAGIRDLYHRGIDFVELIKWRTGEEGRIAALKRQHGLDRARIRGLTGTRIW